MKQDNQFTLWKWIIAHVTNRPVWRVRYPEGGITRQLPRYEANSLCAVFKGKPYIEYSSKNF